MLEFPNTNFIVWTGAAQASGARELLTEDLNAGQDYGGVRAVNPFA